ncbi:uncharacterized protein PFLUO_LOCUS7742 [Penicillium psychrofluorescens]|uniref:uncharacterized protein n=1 Tax=Penicillium psychrofluorescens TaxID=3158075 RepID=UPI003CCCC0EC
MLLRPDAFAIAAWDANLTYHELDIESSSLAIRLRRFGIGPNHIVPLLFERSGWTVVALLAILRADAAFVLLETSFPDNRLQQMIADTKATVGLCSAKQSERMGSMLPDVLIVPSCSSETITTILNSEKSLPATSPQDLAYVAFTSGSTGRPKGAMIDHNAFCASSRTFGRLFQVTSEIRMFQGSSYAFDASIMEILNPLIYGGCVCVPSEIEKRRDPAAAMEDLQANMAMMTPSVLRLLDPLKRPTFLKTIMVGGERVAQQDLLAWGDRVHLGMGYGPAECAVFTMGRPSMAPDSDPTNLGTPPPECRCWVIDQTDPCRLAPLGASGELVIEGPITGRGYVARPDLTARSFSKKAPTWRLPFGPSTHGYYWTGDIVRWQSDGSLQIVGRKDDQVKLHGQRIELSEIERTFSKCVPAGYDIVVDVVSPADHQSTVLAVFVHGPEWAAVDKSPGSEPAAWLVDRPLPSVFQQVCQNAVSYLKQHLPQFMIPTLWLPLAQPPPLTTNGKTDRRQLRDRTAKLSLGERTAYALAASSTPSQGNVLTECAYGTQLLKLVAAVLGGLPEHVDLNIGFLAHGGDSLAAMKVCTLARKENLQIDPLDILQASSLSKVSVTPASCESMVSLTPSPPPSVSLGRFSNLPEGEVQDVRPATELQEFFMDLPYEFIRYHLRGPLDYGRITKACVALVERHGILRTVLDREKDQGRLFQITFRHCNISLDLHHCDEDGSVESTADFLVHQECSGKPPQLNPGEWGARFTLVTSPHNHQHVLVLRLAHTHYDGVSVDALWDDLASLYEQPSPPRAAPSFSQYLSYCEKQVSSAAIDYWQQALQGSSMTYVTGKELPSTPSRLVEASRTILSVEPPRGISLATVVKTGWALALSQHLVKDDIVFGQVVSGRSVGLPGVEGVIGPCMNTLPVRVKLRDVSMPAIELLQQVQTQHFESLRFESMDFSVVRDKCTDWSGETQFGSLVLHQNMLPKLHVHLGEAVGTRTDFYPENSTNEFIIYSIPGPGNSLEIRLATSWEVLDQTTAEVLVASICRWIESLAKSPDCFLEAMMT